MANSNRGAPSDSTGIAIKGGKGVSVRGNSIAGFDTGVSATDVKNLSIENNVILRDVSKAIRDCDPVKILTALRLPFETHPAEVRELLETLAKTEPARAKISDVLSSSRVWDLLKKSATLAEITMGLTDLVNSGLVAAVISVLPK
jgi:hypothetical protein